MSPYTYYFFNSSSLCLFRADSNRINSIAAAADKIHPVKLAVSPVWTLPFCSSLSVIFPVAAFYV